MPEPTDPRAESATDALRCDACGEQIAEDEERGWYALEDGTITSTRSRATTRAWHARCFVPHSLR
jgi:hypothetical protein